MINFLTFEGPTAWPAVAHLVAQEADPEVRRQSEVIVMGVGCPAMNSLYLVADETAAAERFMREWAASGGVYERDAAIYFLITGRIDEELARAPAGSPLRTTLLLAKGRAYEALACARLGLVAPHHDDPGSVAGAGGLAMQAAEEARDWPSLADLCERSPTEGWAADARVAMAHRLAQDGREGPVLKRLERSAVGGNQPGERRGAGAVLLLLGQFENGIEAIRSSDGDGAAIRLLTERCDFAGAEAVAAEPPEAHAAKKPPPGDVPGSADLLSGARHVAVARLRVAVGQRDGAAAELAEVDAILRRHADFTALAAGRADVQRRMGIWRPELPAPATAPAAAPPPSAPPPAARPDDVPSRMADADAAARDGRWASAAELYLSAWRLDVANPLPLYLHGLALRRAGFTADGDAAVLKARLLPLGADDPRVQIASGLEERGYGAEAGQEWALIDSPAYPPQALWRHNAEQNNAANDAAAGRWLQAADRMERTLLAFGDGSTYCVEATKYLRISHQVHDWRARGLLLAGGDADGCVRELHRCIEVLPGDSEPLLACYDGLCERHRGADADALVDDMAHFYEANLARYPGSAETRNALAWLLVNCHRRLGDARRHAEIAVSIEPLNPAFLDTLAEVDFAQGDAAGALKLGLQCLTLAPGDDQIQKHVGKYRAALQ